jgi:hypothetical protein
MSFLDDIIGGAKDIIGGVIGGGGIGGGIVRTAILGFLLNQMNKSVQKENNTPAEQAATPDYGVRLQIDPNADQQVPVLYGSGVFGGIITEAVLSNSNRTMTYVLTLCEKTGVKISDDLASTFKFKNIYWNDNRIVFDSNGFTASYMTDRDGNVDKTIAGLVRVYCFAGNGSTPVVPEGYTNGSLATAYSRVPNWTTNHTMTDLVFAVVQIDYNSERGVTGLPTMTFNIENSMTMPGDCLYDYMTNTRYGAGVPAEEIFGE